MKLVLLVAVVALLATACGAFTDDPYRDSAVGDVSVSPEGRRLQVHILSCARYQLDVEESATEVRLASRAYDDDGDCGGMEVVLRLNSPLGDRDVVDVHGDDPDDVTDCGLRRNRRAPASAELLA